MAKRQWRSCAPDSSIPSRYITNSSWPSQQTSPSLHHTHTHTHTQLEEVGWRLNLQMAQATRSKLKQPNAFFEFSVASGMVSHCLSVCPSVCLSICWSVHLFVCLSVGLSVCLSFHLFVCLSVCLVNGSFYPMTTGEGNDQG